MQTHSQMQQAETKTPALTVLCSQPCTRLHWSKLQDQLLYYLKKPTCPSERARTNWISIVTAIGSFWFFLLLFLGWVGAGCCNRRFSWMERRLLLQVAVPRSNATQIWARYYRWRPLRAFPSIGACSVRFFPESRVCQVWVRLPRRGERHPLRRHRRKKRRRRRLRRRS